MVRRQYAWLRLTHVPTGTFVLLRAGPPRSYHKWVYEATLIAKRFLLAKLHRPPAGPPLRRSYHVHPPLGIAPFIREDGGAIVQGAEVVAAVLDGDFDRVLLARCRSSYGRP